MSEHQTEKAEWFAARQLMRFTFVLILASVTFPQTSRAQAPLFEITPNSSSIKFYVKASVALEGTFDRWDATLTFPSSDVTTGVLNVKFQADSVHTGSREKDGKLKSKSFFNVKEYPLIRFVSKNVVQTGPYTFQVDGDFTIRGVTKTESLLLTISGRGTNSGTIKGTMAFDRKDYGMNSGIPLIKIADRVEVSVDLAVNRVSGPPLVYQQ